MSPLASDPTAKLTAVFVYGTLKRGGENHHYLAAQRYAGEAKTVVGYRLYELDGYPGMVPDESGSGSVSGEIWQVDAACLAQLDKLEGIEEGLYRRAAIPIQPPFDRLPVQTYLYVQSVDGRRPLGDSWPEKKH